MKKTKKLYFFVAFFLIALIFFNVIDLNNRPVAFIYISQYVLIIYLFSLLGKSKLSVLVLIYPVFKYFWYQYYAEDWFLIGDLHNYMGLLVDTFKKNEISLDTILQTANTYSRFYFLTLINIFIPMQIYSIDFGSNNSLILLYFNDLIFLMLTVITTISFKGFLSKRHIRYFVIFLLFSPTILSLTATNDRHLFTLFALLLFVRGYELFNNKNKINFYLILSLLILFLNKKELIVGITFYIFLQNIKFSKKYFTSILTLSLLLIVMYNFKGEILNYYKIFGAGQSIILNLINVPLKYVYGILSPFPWYKYDSHLNVSFGSYFVLFSWFLNSVTGLAVTLSLIYYYRLIKSNTFYFKYFIFFGMIMSTSIILGNTGHAGYLSIYYIFLIPVFFIIGKNKSLSIFFQSFITIILINIIVFIVGF